jgi:hypothetical protein
MAMMRAIEVARPAWSREMVEREIAEHGMVAAIVRGMPTTIAVTNEGLFRCRPRPNPLDVRGAGEAGNARALAAIMKDSHRRARHHLYGHAGENVWRAIGAAEGA